MPWSDICVSHLSMARMMAYIVSDDYDMPHKPQLHHICQYMVVDIVGRCPFYIHIPEDSATAKCIIPVIMFTCLPTFKSLMIILINKFDSFTCGFKNK